MRPLFRAALSTLLLLPLSSTVCLGMPYTIPAHWTDSTNKVEPVVEDFSFDAMDFFAPNEGWIVGYRFLLHVRDDQLTRTFVSPQEAWLRSVDFLSTDDGWAGGFRLAHSDLSEGVIWHYVKDEWVPVDLTSLGLKGWMIDALAFSSHDEGWAVGSWDSDRKPHRGDSILLRYDGETWRVDSSPISGRHWYLIDLCVDASGDGWAVGNSRDAAGVRHPLVAAVRGDVWQAMQIPVPDVSTGALTRVVCLPDGKAMASGLDGKILEGRAMLFAFDGSWRRIELPEKFRPMQITSLFAHSIQDFWLSFAKTGTEPLLVHVQDGDWVEVQRPVIPNGGLQDYGIRGIQFTSEKEGWAIAHDSDGPGLFRGLVLHYQDGVWRNRNWNWHFWDERWFGLFGR